MPTFGSLFAGIGGIDLGLERAGWTCRWQVEIDDYCRRVLRKHWPDVPKHGDVRALTGAELEPVDLVAGGFPCQPHSLAGKRLGKSDPRWLWPEFERILRVLRPNFVLVENVPGLLVRGSGMDDVLGGLASLGYDAEWESIPTVSFGAPHLRYRVFIIAYAHTLQRRIQSLFFSRRAETADVRNNGTGEVAPDADLRRCEGKDLSIRRRRQDQTASFAGWVGSRAADAYKQGLERTELLLLSADDPWYWTQVEPPVFRVDDGVPPRVVRLELERIGNAVSPQVAEWVGRRILEAMNDKSSYRQEGKWR